jgi:hypothetical protein
MATVPVCETDARVELVAEPHGTMATVPVCETDARPRNGAVAVRLAAEVLPERAVIRADA